MKKSSTDNRSGNLEDVFRTGFGEAEVTPSANLWDRIDKQLDTLEQASLYKKKATFYGRLVLLSALLLLLVGGAWLYQYQQSTPAGTAAEARLAQAAPQATTAPEPAAQQPEANTGSPATPKAPGNNYPTEADFPAKPTQTTPGPNPATTGTATTERQPAQQTTPASVTSQNAAKPALPAGKSATAAAKTVSGPQQNAAAKALVKQKETTPTATAKNSAPAGQLAAQQTNSQAGQAQDLTGLQEQTTSTNSTAATPPAKPGNLATDAAAASHSAVSAAVPATEVQAIAVTPPAGGNQLPVADSAAAPLASTAGAPLVIIPANVASDSVAAAFAEHEPGPKGSFSITMLYAGYQFEQGLVVSSTVPGATPPSAAYRKAAQEFNELAKPARSYRAEVRAAYWFHDRLRLETGLGFSRNRALTLSTYEIRSFIFNPGSGAMELATQSSIIEPVLAGAHRDSVAAVSVPEFETSYQYDYLSVPVRVTYQSDSHGWHWFASGGASAARLLNSRVSSTRDGLASSTKPKQAFRNWNFAGVFSFGLGYQFNQRISFGIGPDLSYSLNSLMSSDKAGIRQANPYTVGVSGGLTYTFR